MYMLD